MTFEQAIGNLHDYPSFIALCKTLVDKAEIYSQLQLTRYIFLAQGHPIDEYRDMMSLFAGTIIRRPGSRGSPIADSLPPLSALELAQDLLMYLGLTAEVTDPVPWETLFAKIYRGPEIVSLPFDRMQEHVVDLIKSVVHDMDRSQLSDFSDDVQKSVNWLGVPQEKGLSTRADLLDRIRAIVDHRKSTLDNLDGHELGIATEMETQKPTRSAVDLAERLKVFKARFTPLSLREPSQKPPQSPAISKPRNVIYDRRNKKSA